MRHWPLVVESMSITVQIVLHVHLAKSSSGHRPLSRTGDFVVYGSLGETAMNSKCLLSTVKVGLEKATTRRCKFVDVDLFKDQKRSVGDQCNHRRRRPRPHPKPFWLKQC